MNSKTSIVLSTIGIAAIVLLFGSSPIVANQQAFADGHHNYNHQHHHHHHHKHYYHH